MSPVFRPSSLLAIAAVIGACSSGNGVAPDLSIPDATAADFGLEDRRCLRFAEASGEPNYTVEIMRDTTSVAGVETWSLLHRWNGWEQFREWVALDGRSLVLHRRSESAGGTPTAFSVFNPPPAALALGMSVDAAPLSSTTQVKRSGSVSDTVPQEFSVSLDETVSLDVLGATVEAGKYTRMVLSNGSNVRTERLWFVPSRGLVQLDPPGTEIGLLHLVSSSILAAGETCTLID